MQLNYYIVIYYIWSGDSALVTTRAYRAAILSLVPSQNYSNLKKKSNKVVCLFFISNAALCHKTVAWA